MGTGKTVQAISRRKFLQITTASALLVVSGKTLAKDKEPKIVLKMFADLGCPHCQKTFGAIMPLLQGAKNIDFHFRPVLPANVSDVSITPSPAVRFYYTCEKFLDESQLLRVASALFAGVREKAEMSSFDSVYQWVMLQGLSLDYKKLKDSFEKFGPYSKFEDALSDFKFYQVNLVPYFVAENQAGERLSEWRWGGDDQTFIESISKFIKEN